MNENWLTAQEAMQYLRIRSKTTLHTIAATYGIRRTKLLSITYYSREDIDTVMNENAVVWQPNLRA